MDASNLRMDNVLIVVDDLDAAKSFFIALGMVSEGEATVGGSEVDRLIGLTGTAATLVFLRTPDGSGRIELDKFHSPKAIDPGPLPVNAIGIRRLMFEVDNLDTAVARLLDSGAELIGEIVHYGETFRLAYVRGPEGIIVGLSQKL